MDLTCSVIEEVIHPTAAFIPVSQSDQESEGLEEIPGVPGAWETSLLNPVNRIDSLDFPCRSLWRVDGCGGVGTQFFVVPIFLPNPPPMRMDVFVHEKQSMLLRTQLELPTAFHTKDRERLSRLAIVRHIIRTLNRWTEANFNSPEAFDRFYRSIPFGSRLVFENLSLNISKIRVRVGPNYDLEHKFLDVNGLRRLWGPDFVFPDEIDFFDLQTVKVLHDSVCLVRIRGELFIFKALVSGVKYLYHELRTLCSIESHPNIIARPIHIVKKKSQFGAKRSVIGFTTFYHPQGTLRDIIPQLRIHRRLLRPDQIKWSLQIAEALAHFKNTSKTYYPDLRLDNIVLSGISDVVMVDFEQRGVWCEFGPPEVNAIEYMRLIATGGERVPESEKERCLERLRRLVPNYDALEEEHYTNPEHGYTAAWIALSPTEQEAAEVYMLGRIMWCIFEGVSGPQKAAVWQSYRWESHLEVPEYERTPLAIRELIDRCTRGRRTTLASIIARQRSKLVVICNPDSGLREEQREEDVRDVAGQFWRAEMEAVEDFLNLRDTEREMGVRKENYYDRPSLKEVIDALQAYQATVSSQGEDTSDMLGSA